MHELPLQPLPVAAQTLLFLMYVLTHDLHRVLVEILQTADIRLPHHCQMHLQKLVFPHLLSCDLLHSLPQGLHQPVILSYLLRVLPFDPLHLLQHPLYLLALHPHHLHQLTVFLC